MSKRISPPRSMPLAGGVGNLELRDGQLAIVAGRQRVLVLRGKRARAIDDDVEIVVDATEDAALVFAPPVFVDKRHAAADIGSLLFHVAVGGLMFALHAPAVDDGSSTRDLRETLARAHKEHANQPRRQLGISVPSIYPEIPALTAPNEESADFGIGQYGIGDDGIGHHGIGEFGVGQFGIGQFGVEPAAIPTPSSASLLEPNLFRAASPQKPIPLSTPMAQVTRIPPEVIRRTVRLGFGRLRHCYQADASSRGLSPEHVTVRFVIAESGSVTVASASGASRQGLNECVRNAFLAMSFPESTGGPIRVTYPIAFTPSE